MNTLVLRLSLGLLVLLVQRRRFVDLTAVQDIYKTVSIVLENKMNYVAFPNVCVRERAGVVRYGIVDMYVLRQIPSPLQQLIIALNQLDPTYISSGSYEIPCREKEHSKQHALRTR